jgi:phytoene synthase
VSDLLDLADRYYDSAANGMRYIPARARLGIVAAARMYRAIGSGLRRRGCDALLGRVVVSGGAKAIEIASSILWAPLAPVLARAPHVAELHAPLAGLPGVASEPLRLREGALAG